MDTVELAEDASSTQGAGGSTRADRVNPVEEWGREVENCGEGSRARTGKVTEQHEESRKRRDKNEPEEDMEEELPIRPAGVVARFCPGAR